MKGGPRENLGLDKKIGESQDGMMKENDEIKY